MDKPSKIAIKRRSGKSWSDCWANETYIRVFLSTRAVEYYMGVLEYTILDTCAQYLYVTYPDDPADQCRWATATKLTQKSSGRNRDEESEGREV